MPTKINIIRRSVTVPTRHLRTRYTFDFDGMRGAYHVPRFGDLQIGDYILTKDRVDGTDVHCIRKITRFCEHKVYCNILQTSHPDIARRGSWGPFIKMSTILERTNEHCLISSDLREVNQEFQFRVGI